MLLNISVAPEALALLPDGTSSGAANKYCMWLRTWGGATAELEVMGEAYQDLAGNKGAQSNKVQVCDCRQSCVVTVASLWTYCCASTGMWYLHIDLVVHPR